METNIVASSARNKVQYTVYLPQNGEKEVVVKKLETSSNKPCAGSYPTKSIRHRTPPVFNLRFFREDPSSHKEFTMERSRIAPMSPAHRHQYLKTAKSRFLYPYRTGQRYCKVLTSMSNAISFGRSSHQTVTEHHVTNFIQATIT